MRPTNPDVTQRSRRAVIYARISQDRTGAHLGVDRQVEDCQSLADRMGWEVVETYVDNDISAYSGKKRPDYLRMLEELGAGLATEVLVWHSDRLHRSNIELEHYIDFSERHGVTTHTVQSGRLDLASPSGRMNARIVGAVARHESEHKAARVASARLQKAKAGKWGGGIRPFGWGVPTGEFRKKVDRKTGDEVEVPVLDMDQLVPEEAAAIEVGIDMILSGGSIKGWCRWLADKELTTTRGNPVGHVEARDMLMRARNAGIAVYRGEEIGPGSWTAIVPEEKHRAVVAVLMDPNRRTTPGAQPKWLGSLLYRCGRDECTTTVYVTQSGGARYPSYRCRTAHGGGRRADRVDEYVQDTVIARLSREDAADLLLPGPSAVNVAALQVEHEQIRRRLTDLAAMFGAGQIDMQQFAEGSDVARSQLEGVEQQMGRAAVKDPLVKLVGAKDVGKAWHALPLEEKRGVLRTLVTVTLTPPKLGPLPGGGRFDYDAVKFSWLRGSD
ncbi:recombinase family protein [Streptomyces virginiae]|uniref:recombinase family protein n=1 Tax=Streptomyces virginiae TaxID=1961 RepID=UPI0034127AEF